MQAMPRRYAAVLLSMPMISAEQGDIAISRRYEAKDQGPVQIHLDGENVGEGEVRLDALAGFIDGFQSTLRRLVQLRLGKKPVTGRLPDQLRQAVDIRLVGFGKGSATLLVRPGTEDAWGSPAASALEEFGRRVEEPESEWDEGTTEALEQARRSLGKGGRFTVRGEGVRVSVDENVTARLSGRARRVATAVTRHTVVGWLHMADLQPNEVTVKTALGVEWRCHFAPEMKSRILGLLDQVVVAEGPGSTKDRTGELTIEAIRPSLPEAYQMTIDRDFEAIVEERVRQAPPRERVRARAADGAHISDGDIDDLMAAIREIDE